MFNRKKRLLGVYGISFLFLSSVSCITPALAKPEERDKRHTKEKETPMTYIPQVAIGWQKKVLAWMEQEKWDESWALYSEGGWSDAGQVIILANKDRSRAALKVVTANNRETALDKPFTVAKLEQLKPLIEKAQKLSDVDEPMFDGLIFEYVHIGRNQSGQLNKNKSVYIRATGRVPHKEHEELVKTFQDLKGES